MNKAYFIFSDVHGQFDSLIRVLKEQGFSAANKNHILVNLGDSFDRGPKNKEMLEWLLQQDRLISIRGNHDDFLFNLLKTPRDYALVRFNMFYNGFDKTIEQLLGISIFKSDVLDLTNEQIDDYAAKILQHYPTIINYMDSMVDEVVLGKFSLTHAGRSNVKNHLTGETEWVVNSWAKTPEFVRNYPDDGMKHIFGHWGAFKLHNEFNLGYSAAKIKNSEDNMGAVFKSKDERFWGIDAWSNASLRVNVLIYTADEKEEPILKLHR